MALTEHDKKTLSKSDQQKIQQATNAWNVANKNGDTAGMAKAAAEAAAVRNRNGYQTDSSGNYTGSYTPTSSGGSSGGGSYSGNSGGGSKGGNSQYTGSNKNSQYTAPTLGNTWDANTDYQAIINSAVANGDYVTAAKAEQLRNQKIISTGSNYNTTNMYQGHLQPDLGTKGQQQMANNASWEDVLDTYNSRFKKASTTVGLEQYANDEIQDMMWNYIVDKMKESNQPDEWEEPERPDDYQSKYDPQIDAILNEILNRDDFSYDVASDPLYQQYAKMYQREGDRAMKETMAEAAAGAGGMNTYAITAAQQANSYYNAQLNDRIPELYQLAYDMYINDKESKVQDLGILQNMDATQYNRYRDTINDWYNDKNFAYGVYQDAVQQGNWQTNFDYNAMLDNRNFNNDNYWKNKDLELTNREWDYNESWDNKKWSKEEQDDAKAEVEYWMSNGIMPDDELIAKSGMNKATIEQRVAQVKAEQAAKITTSDSYTYTGTKTKDEGKTKDDEKKTEDDLGYTPTAGGEDEGESIGIGNGIGTSGVLSLGLGAISDEALLNLVNSGAVILNADGSVQWANGYNKDNYELALSKLYTGIYPTLQF